MDGDEVTARLFAAINHPVANVEVVVEGEVIRAVQLKAVASADAIRESLERYPEIECFGPNRSRASSSRRRAATLRSALSRQRRWVSCLMG